MTEQEQEQKLSETAMSFLFFWSFFSSPLLLIGFVNSGVSSGPVNSDVSSGPVNSDVSPLHQLSPVTN